MKSYSDCTLMKSYSDSTLMSMSKKELIEQIRILEHNYNTANSFLEQQARNFEGYLNKLKIEIGEAEDEKGIYM